MEQSGRSSLVWFGKLAASHLRPEQKKENIPILFIHGAWGGKYQFENWMRFCAERGWESYALDLRGHHQSECENYNRASINDFAEDVEQVIKTIGPCYLIGHSKGGLVAQLVASKNSSIKKAVFVATAPPAGIIYINSFIIRMFRYLPKMLLHQPVLITKREAQNFLFNNRNTSAYESLIPEPVDIQIISTRIKRILCPTLVIAAQSDRMLPIELEKRIARKYKSDFIEIPDMGHMMMLEEEWKRPIEKILEWLNRTD